MGHEQHNDTETQSFLFYLIFHNIAGYMTLLTQHTIRCLVLCCVDIVAVECTELASREYKVANVLELTMSAEP